MLDIKFIRENAELVKEAARKKRIDFKVEELLEADAKRLAALSQVEEMRAKQNEASAKIAQAASDVDRQAIIADMTELKAALQAKEEELKPVMKEWQRLMLAVPNVPDMSVPEGEDDSQNQEVKAWGERRKFDFVPKSHVELMQKLHLADFDRGTKAAGFRGYFLKNEAAELSFAIWQAALEHFMGKGFSPMIVPSLVRPEGFLGTGYLPQGEEDLYKTQDGDFLAGTAEVATMAYFMDETLDLAALPKKFVSFSPCFRREAGSHGKDTKGLIRVHEFYKVEQVVLCQANHEESVRLHEEINRNTEEFIEKLAIPYRTVVNCGGDLGLGQVKKYDIELWVPAENKYREISSASYFHDFQCRRLNIRYKDAEGKLRFAHSLNATAIPTPRILVSIIENYQNADGTITVPEVLRKYLGKDLIK
ncbi:MAG TPA: serine--tRNA ligase [Candidatus Paceibacterota bacterium]|nr:serine--tRNA ligase [Candidatus Paceibacterota bacterium]